MTVASNCPTTPSFVLWLKSSYTKEHKGKMAAGGIQTTQSERRGPCDSPSWEPSASLSRCETHWDESWLSRAPYRSRQVTTYRPMQAWAIRDCTTLWDIYRRKQRQGCRWSEEEQAQENRGIRSWSLVCTVVWRCPGPCKCRLFSLIKFHF